MQKGFGFYSPHETTVFFLKTALVSLWICIDLVVALVVANFQISVLLQHGFFFLGAVGILIAGTVFSILFAWATGSLFGKQDAPKPNRRILHTLQRLKQEPHLLVLAGIIGASCFLIVAACLFTYARQESVVIKQIRHVNPILASKCIEVASLEKKLFQSDEKNILGQCLTQYDETYAALRDHQPPE